MTKIFYFSATGNSLKIARDVAEVLTDALILPMVEDVKQELVGGQGEMLGFVFPVYFNGLPRLVKRFVENLDIAAGTYCFAIANSGGTRSNVLGELDNVFVTKGLHLSFADEIKVLTNYIIAHPLPEKVQVGKLVAQATQKAKEIAQFVSTQELRPAKHQVILWSRVVNYNFLYKNANRWDEKFSVTETCSGCGICAKVCPVNNISLRERIPFWQHKCEKCLACIHWCPCQAIEYGENTRNRGRYHNPFVQVKDIIKSRGVHHEL